MVLQKASELLEGSVDRLQCSVHTMDKENEIKIGEATYTVERQFSGKKTLKELLVEHIISAKKKEDAKNAPDIDEIA